MGPPVARIALLLFGSGLCALIYQVAWLRELRLIFGASTAASAAVLAVFMAGLGAGGIWLGRRAGKMARPLQFYAHLELGIAASAAATPFLVWLARRLYSAVGGTVVLGLGGGTVVRLVLAVAVLAVPTFLMGGTLPAAAQAVETDGDVGRRRIAILYGTNTLGAVAGTLLSTFALQEILGTRRMLWAACALNALVAMLARVLSRKLGDANASVSAYGNGNVNEGGNGNGNVNAKRPPARMVLIAAAVVGFAFLLMELVWYRMLGPLLGGSSFTFGLILAIALLGIGLGGGAYALFSGKRTPTLYGFALTAAAEAAFIALPYALGDRVAVWTAMLKGLGSIGFGGQVAVWAAIAALVVLPAAFVSGVQFPLLIALLGKGDDEVGRQVGQAYAWNTAGAIAGSLAGGFGLLPILSAPGAWRLVVVLLAALALVAAGLAITRDRESARAVRPVALALLSVVLLFALGPTAAWRHSAIGAGRGPSPGSPNMLGNWANAMRRAIVWEAEGRESSVAIDNEAGVAFVVNGKIDGNARSDAPTQVMSGLIGAIVHPDVKKALVVGLGTGSTAGWLGALPHAERVDVAELEPAILHVAKECAPVNRAVLDNPKVHIFVGDAREMLLTTRERYDVIFSEPSNPYRAGISSLFTQEFYRAAAERLDEGGLFLQWVQAYSVDAQTVRSVIATVQSVFPSVEMWITEEADLLLVASRRAPAYDLPKLQARIQEEPFRTALANVWRVNDLEGLFAHYAARGSLAQSIYELDADELSTDDLTLVEYGFARGVGRRASLFNTDELRRVARTRGEDRPLGLEKSIDWGRVDERRISMLTAQEMESTSLPYRYSDAALKRGLAEASWGEADFAAALSQWQSQPQAPEDLVELVVVAESLADKGDEAAMAPIGKLRAFSPTLAIEADAILGRLRLRQGRLAEATDALEAAFRAYRTDPWPLPALMTHALKLPIEVAAKDPKLGERLYQALRPPFAVSMLNGIRMNTVMELAIRIDFRRLCAEALAPFEPHPTWKRDFLAGRLQCYELTSDPRAARARRDLARFAAAEPLPFASGLTK
jgi:spermidine synthase